MPVTTTRTSLPVRPSWLDRMLGRQPEPQAPLRSITAASKRISGKKIVRSSKEAWQDEAWAAYQDVGELRFASNRLAGSLSRATLYVGRVDDVTDDTPTPLDADEDGTIVDIFDAFGGGKLARAELIRRLALQLFVPGDGWIVGVDPALLGTSDDPSGQIGPDRPAVDDATLDELDWYCLSVDEVTVTSSRVTLRFGDEKDEHHMLPHDDVILIRVWRPHPRRWWQADSPVRSNLPVLRELIGLTKHVGANIDSRLAGAGMLIVPNEATVASPLAQDPDSDDPQGDPLTEALMDVMITPIRDRDSAAAVVPIVLRVPAAVVDKVQHLKFSTEFDAQTKELRDEAIRRLALGLDMPPEEMLGMSQSNHWTGWLVEESTVKVHLEPVLALICDAITTDYLWPALTEARVPDPERYVVWFDTTPLTLRHNDAKEAQALHDRGVISDEALRDASGYTDTDAPPKADRAVEVALKMLQGEPGLAERIGVDQLIDVLRRAIDAGTVNPDGTPAGPSGNGQPDGGAPLPDTLGEQPEPVRLP